MDNKKQKLFFNRSLERALHILCAFSFDNQTLTQSQLSDIVKLPRSTVTRLCSTLTDFGFLRCDQQSYTYSLGLRLFQLGSVVFSNFSLRRVAAAHLTHLKLKLGKTVFLGILENDELVYIDKREDARDNVLFGSDIGTRRPPSFGMLGQVLMAFLPDIDLALLLQRKPLMAFTKESITDEDRFRERLSTIRKYGFAIEDGEAIDGVTGIAAPIRDFRGEVVAAVGVSFISSSVDDIRGEVVAAVGAGFISSSVDDNGKYLIIKHLVTTAHDISQELGYFPGTDRARANSVEGRKGK